MKKIEPVRPYAVFTTSSKFKEGTPEEIKKELIKIISKQLSNNI